jgi:caa(3)-type oxidase subunit IV
MNKKSLVFTVLLIITAIQIGLSYVSLSSEGNLVAALLLGGCETILVGLYFMGLDNEKRLIKVTALFPFVLFCIMNGALILDVLIFSKR